MRDIFQDIFRVEPIEPVAAARRAMRPNLRRRFYHQVTVAESEGDFGLRLDGRPVRTPARRTLAAPTRALAECLAAEWRAQADVVDPGSMPLTRLANAIIDGVAKAPEPVVAEVAR